MAHLARVDVAHLGLQLTIRGCVSHGSAHLIPLARCTDPALLDDDQRG